MKRWTPVMLAALLVASLALAQIHIWSNGDKVQAADLNNNFSFITGRMVGQSGARLVDADVSNTAAITHSKLATPALLPKAWVAENGTCDAAQTAGTPCSSPSAASRMTLSASGTAGEYQINVVGFAPTSLSFAFTCTPVNATAGFSCSVNSNTYQANVSNNIAHVNVVNSAGTKTNSGLIVVMYDTTNE